MSITRVQEASASVPTSFPTSSTVTLGSAPTNGNNLILVVGYDSSSTAAIASISQTGATWVKAVASNFNDGARVQNAEIWYAENVSGAGTVVTLNYTASQQLGGYVFVAEYSGLLTSASLDKLATNHGLSGGTTIDSGTTATTTQASELWIGALAEVETAGPSFSAPTNGFTIVDSNWAQNAAVAYCEKIVSATGAADVTVTVSAQPFSWAGCIATFKGSGAGPTSAKQLLSLLGCGA